MLTKRRRRKKMYEGFERILDPESSVESYVVTDKLKGSFTFHITKVSRTPGIGQNRIRSSDVSS